MACGIDFPSHAPVPRKDSSCTSSDPSDHIRITFSLHTSPDSALRPPSSTCSIVPTPIWSTVRVVFDVSSAFNSIRPTLLGDQLTVMQVDAALVSWIVVTCCYRKITICASST